MGFSKQRQRENFPSGIGIGAVQALTGASTATDVFSHGVTKINSTAAGTAGAHAFVMRSPKTGLLKTVVVNVDSTREVILCTNSTTVLFYGSTHNIATFSTGNAFRSIALVGLSTSSWGVLAKSTGVTLSASTIQTRNAL